MLKGKTLEQNSGCIICAGRNFAVVGRKEFRDIPTSKERFNFSVHLACCRHCGLVFQYPLQDTGKMEEYYRYMFREEEARPASFLEQQFATAADFINGFAKREASLLEVGCADGSFLKRMQDSGMKVFGIEPSEKNFSLGKEKGLNLFKGTYEEFALAKGNEFANTFDIIVSLYVLEHLNSPVNFLSFCNRILKQGGMICMEIPLIELYQNEESATDMLFFFEHQYHFSKESLGLLLRCCGFQLQESLASATRPFGLLFAAKKVALPLPAAEMSIAQENFKLAITKISAYRKLQHEKEEGLRKRLLNAIKEKQINRDKKIVIFGAGSHTQQLFKSFGDIFKEIPVSFIVDNDSQKQGRLLNNIPVKQPQAIDSSVDAVIVSSCVYEKEIYQQLKNELSVEKERIITLYS